MSHYLILTTAGVLALLFALLLADEECDKRHKAHERLLHTQLVLCDANGPNGDLTCTLYRTDTMLGRRKRRSDVCLAVYKDGRISRSHAILSYDGENVRIKPVFRLSSLSHTQIIVESQLVPPQGRVVRYGERITIAGHLLLLQNTEEAEVTGT